MPLSISRRDGLLFLQDPACAHRGTRPGSQVRVDSKVYVVIQQTTHYEFEVVQAPPSIVALLRILYYNLIFVPGEFD